MIGSLVAAAGFALLALPGAGASYWTGFLPGIAVLGLGMAIVVAPLTTTVMDAVPQASAGTASGVNNALSRVAGVLAIAVFGALMAAVFQSHLHEARDHLPAGVADALWRQRDRLAAIEATGAARETVRHAFVAGYRWIMLASAALAVASAAIAAAWVRNEVPERE